MPRSAPKQKPNDRGADRPGRRRIVRKLGALDLLGIAGLKRAEDVELLRAIAQRAGSLAVPSALTASIWSSTSCLRIEDRLAVGLAPELDELRSEGVCNSAPPAGSVAVAVIVTRSERPFAAT